MKSNTIRGGEILNSIKDVWDEEYAKIASEICRYHRDFQMIVTGEGGMFSPKLLECFRNSRQEFEQATDNNKKG